MRNKMSFEKISWQRLYYYAALLYAFFIALDQQLATIALIVWAVFSLINFNRLSLNKTRYLFLLPLLYLTYLFGTVISGVTSLSFLEHKLSMLVFPLIFFLHVYTREERIRILRFFVYGLVVGTALCVFMAFYRSMVFEDDGLKFIPNVLEGKAFLESIIYGGNHFFGNHFSMFHQTVYFGLYLCTGIAILLFSQEVFNRKKRFILICAFTGVLFLISNKAAFLVLGLLYVYRILSAKISQSKKAIIIIGFVTVGLLFAFINPRFKESIRKLANNEIGVDKNARYDFATRILSWDAALLLIGEKPLLGYGGGSAQQELNRVYTEKEYTFPLKEQLNAHNQFFQIWIENGLLGLVVLTGIFIALFRVCRNVEMNRNLFFAILLVVFVNMLFESVFNRFSGVSFISFIVCFIFSETKERGGDQ
ncbi:O-antigen ligase family protein [Muriicola sp. Z0-33]|uniref:O-antigen ligase family protein n=1 Tax=Muriicola sp. Z0-33 TaxID=2816957 RepID=UPI0022390495|nr:O-antigen ligase family protein [Muriicola sp. Z0-33]MCW5514645.1 O-antigen ligase family protein [Muriicola sp. Z0-33]